MERAKTENFTTDPRIAGDIQTLALKISQYCGHAHADRTREPLAAVPGIAGEYLKDVQSLYCSECRKLLLHGVSKRTLCSHDPKPQCKNCPDPCYSDAYREGIHKVMRFKGPGSDDHRESREFST